MSNVAHRDGDTQASSFGRYQVVRLLGAGGMGEVFLARDQLLGRDVAVKTLRPPLGIPGFAAEAFRTRFVNEARTVASLAHPNIVQVFDLGFEGEVPFIVMEVVAGQSLRDRIKDGERLTAAEARTLGVQMGRALEAAHARGIVHRDVKPGNVLEAEPGLWKLADFGVAHVPDSSLTITGQFIGSPAYAAPEGLLAGEFSPATDIYGLGATLCEALCGRPPYANSGQVSAAALARAGDPQPIGLRCPGLPADLARLVQTALSRDPKARPTAAQLAAGLAGTSERVGASPPRSAAAPVAIAAPALSEIVIRAAADATRAAASVARGLAGRVSDRYRLSDRKRLWWVAGGIVAVIVVVIIVLAVSGGEPAVSPSRYPRPSATADRGWFSAPTPRSREEQKRWNKARDKLAEGKYEDAAKELEKLLRRDPDDAEARRLLDSMQNVAREHWDDN